MEKIRAHVVVTGRVQGVFFRMETKHAAERTGVSGWVRNKNDGTVEAVFEGDEDRVDSVVEWCREGPPYARVIKVDVNRQAYQGEFEGFKITY